jgi:parallel beta-helix repeat protein
VREDLSYSEKVSIISAGAGAKKILIQGTVGTVISIANGQTGINVNTTITTGFGNNQDLVIRDIRFEGLTDDATAIYLEDVHLGTIEGNTFVGDSLTAISMKRVNNAKIQRNYFNKVKRGVYGLSGSTGGDDLEDIAIIGNDFSYCQWSAIHLESTSDIWQRDVSKISIIGNNIEESDYAGLYKFAIYLRNSKGSTIVGNTITQTKRGGAIELQDGSLNIISSNIFRENGEAQEVGDTTSTVMIRSSDSNVFIGNTISNENADYGFTFISSSNNEFIGNISEFDSLTTYRQFGGSGNVVWSPQGGGGSSFDPDADITFTGDNTHTGKEWFSGGQVSGTEPHFKLTASGSGGSYFTIQAAHTTGNAAGIKTYAHGGSLASPTSTLAGQFIGLWSARGVATTSLLQGASAYLGFIADSNWGSGDTPSRAVIATTPDGSATSAIRLYHIETWRKHRQPVKTGITGIVATTQQTPTGGPLKVTG